MQMRTLGKSGVQVAPIVLGGNVFGWTADEKTSFAILDAFVDRSFNFIDTADVYSRWVPGHKGGESEAILGKWFAQSGKRNKVVIATKVGMEMPDFGSGLKAEYIERAVEASLKRLETDHIDLYQSHKDDASTPLEETLRAYDALIRAGKVRMIGASNYTGARLTEAMDTSSKNGLPEYVTLQPEYNLHARKEYETDLAPVVAKYGLAVIPYFSLAAGFLTGKYKKVEDTKGTSREKSLAKYFDERGERILKALDYVAKETGAPQASIALAWLLAQPHIAGPIASATSTKQLESLFAAADLKLTDAQLKTLTEASVY
ncbi:MAG: aldo/keto reductase [Acidobacteria bacterium]|nr:aldo/keto reductase [Acidobacteriota bacterium]